MRSISYSLCHGIDQDLEIIQFVILARLSLISLRIAQPAQPVDISQAEMVRVSVTFQPRDAQLKPNGISRWQLSIPSYFYVREERDLDRIRRSCRSYIRLASDSLGICVPAMVVRGGQAVSRRLMLQASGGALGPGRELSSVSVNGANTFNLEAVGTELLNE